MDSPQVGFRRAAVASWALVGVGIAGVLGGSVLAYADTIEKQSAQASAGPAEAAPAAPVIAGTAVTTTTSMAPSYSPSYHSRTRGS